ncbi:MAG: hypothetical protein IT376_04945 [Polyangiaceae bacterium]|nr:hypothetical protein [Polyangiaceae bacterium]
MQRPRLLPRVRTPLLGAGLALALVAVQAAAVGTRRFELEQADDFKGGDLTGTAVTSRGEVRAGLTLGATPVPETTTIWSALRRADGGVLLGTGNDGKLFEVKGDKPAVVAETKALAITSMTEAWGAVILATIPDGKLFKWEKGKLTELATLKETAHVWAVAYDKRTDSVFAATGPQGKLWRVSKTGDAQVHFDAEEEHLMSVAVGADGTVYTGGGDKAKLYQVTAPGRGTVFYDFGRTEVRSIAVGADGSVYAIANEMPGGFVAPMRPMGGMAPGMMPSPGAGGGGGGPRGRGVLVRVERDGVPDTLFEDSSEHFTSLQLADGKAYVGTGGEGRVYEVDDDHGNVLLADVEERQVTALALGGKDPFVAASDAAVLHPVRGVGGADAVWTSKVLDAGLRAKWGRLRWESSGTLELSTRTGNTTTPDSTWSPWGKGITAPGAVDSPPGRFVQVRARWTQDPSVVLTALDLAFVTDNLRATITGVDASSAAKRSSSGVQTGVRASGGAVAKSSDTRVNLTWRVDNPDQDELRYRLQYRVLGANAWYELTKPTEKLTGTSYSWETADLPEGRYKVRVTVSDELSNPPGRVKKHSRESGVVLVDNTAPTVEALKVNGRRVSGVALDGIGPIQRIEFSVVGTDEWFPFEPTDGIFDEAREEFDADVSGLSPQGPALLTLRVYDTAGNVVVRSVALR